MATLYAKAAGGNWSAAATWSNVNSGGGDSSGPPTAADNVIFEAGSGNVTIDAAAAARGVDCASGTGNYAGVLTHNAGINLTLGDGTAAAGNIILRFTAGMTYTLGNSTTSAIVIATTSGTQQTMNVDAKTLGNLTQSGVGSNIILGSNLICGTFTFSSGTFDTGNFTVTMINQISAAGTRTLTLGSSTINVTTGNFGFSGASSTLTATTSTINMQGNSVIFTGDAGDAFNNVVWTGSGSHTLTNDTTFANFTITGAAVKTEQMSLGGNLTVTNTITVNGNSVINRVLLLSTIIGTPRTITAATVTMTNVDLKDITGAGAGSWNLSAITGLSGDAGGNSGITFTTPATQTATGTASFVWSTHGWTSRVPLPQDDVSIPNAFIAGRTITIDMPRIGKNITYTCTGNPTATYAIAAVSIFGSVTYASTANLTIAVSANAITLEGRGAHTITSAGQTFGGSCTIKAFGGTYTLQDAFSTTLTLDIQNGTFETQNFSVSCATILFNQTFTKVLSLGTSQISLTSTAATSIIQVGVTGTTMTTTTHTFIVASTSANTRTISTGGFTRMGSLTYTIAGSTGQLNFTGSATFVDFNFSDASNARTVAFTAGTTTTFTGLFNVFGQVGNLVTIGSITAANHTLSKASGIVNTVHDVSISRSQATGGATWYAGATPPSVDGGNNSGWIFTAAPAAGGGGSTNLLLMGVGM